MRTSDHVFQLILSMSKAEKRYFKLQAEREQRSGRNRQVELFTILEKLGSYDEELVRKQLQGVRDFTACKFRLYDLVLKSLYEFRSRKSPTIRAAEMARHAETLQTRGLHTQAGSLIKRARRIVDEHELLPLALELLNLDRQLILNSADAQQIVALQSIAEQEQVLNRKITNQTAYEILWLKIAAVRKKRMDALSVHEREALQSLLEDDLLSAEDKALTRRAKRHYWRIKAEVAFMTRNQEAAYENYRILLETWQTHPAVLPEDLQRHRRDEFNFLNACLAASREAEIEPALKRIKQSTHLSADEERKTFQGVVYFESVYYLATGRMERGKQLLPEIEAGLKRYEGRISSTRLLTIQVNTGLLHFFCAEYDQALHWMNTIIDSPGSELRQDIRGFARVLLLVIHFELGSHPNLMESLLRSVQRFLQRSKGELEFGRLLVSYIKRLHAGAPGVKRKKLFAELSQQIQQIKKDSAGDRLPSGLNEFHIWVRSKTRGEHITRTYQSFVQEAVL